jgi:hypothetical protein
MKNESRIETHKPRTGRIGRHRIVREKQFDRSLRSSPCKGPFPSIASIPSAITKSTWDGRTDIEDALVNSVPMENVLRPPVFHHRHDGRTCS